MIAIIAGTNRPESNTRKIAQKIETLYRELGDETELLDLANLPPELFSPAAYAKKPAGFKAFTDVILAADGLAVVTPEYNGGIPGVLKYFIDMLPFPESFEGKPVAFTGLAAGIWGALRPVEQLQQVFGYRNAHIFPERVFIPGVISVLNEKSEITDEKLVARLEGQARGFSRFVSRLKH
jgi:chromate reductase